MGSRGDRRMAIRIYDLERQEIVGVLRDCPLCGETFKTELHSEAVICPRCKKLWKKIVEREAEE